MKDRVGEHPEFTTKIQKNPIELLKVIKVLMHAPKRAQYPLIEWLSGIRRFVNIRQEPKESLSDYFKRFSQEFDTFKAQFGSSMFDGAVMNLKEYTSTQDETEKRRIKKEAFEAFASITIGHQRPN
jgi:hypothetical protein